MFYKTREISSNLLKGSKKDMGVCVWVYMLQNSLYWTTNFYGKMFLESKDFTHHRKEF